MGDVMVPNDVLLTLPVTAWHGSFDTQLQADAVDALESGHVLVLPHLPFAVTEAERALLAPDILGGRRKNISLDPGTRTVRNTALDPADAERLAAMMERFAQSATRLVSDLMPGYAPHLERARTSFRPAEIAGRTYSPRHDDRLLHVDAFPTRPMRGRRILRLFNNIAPDGAPREWRVGEPFEDFARAFLPRIRPAVPGAAFVQQLLGLTKGRRAAYDHIMLGLHDAGKLDSAYQSEGPKVAASFAAGSTWMCFTDQVLHAALAGHCALEQTFHLPVASMAYPERSPLRILEKLAGRALN
jgi:hypothetical protein